ncbi:DUF2501 domain-containing protein [Marinivivus vitaminiproducens]|uniref:DUF2501 domain-containing protein n=1 Tax=Marinivivus vitaminiproducens TaxID=3035935 RepID=UPI00279A04BE|nr:DUF2501 domain-containing protein [Geminicoccaceae bacterium SCSIO 64248]
MPLRILTFSAAVAAVMASAGGPVQAAGLGDALSNLGGGGLPAVSDAGAGNTAGLLSYCVKNNYLNQQSASSVLGNLTGQGDVAQSEEYSSGESGLLETGGGESFSLANIQDQAKSQVCDLVLEHAKSFM